LVKNSRLVLAGLGQFPFLFLVVEDFQEQHPDQLADTLSVAVDAHVFAHDVLDGFDRGGDGHEG
jgi:hypothetical protein